MNFKSYIDRTKKMKDSESFFSDKIKGNIKVATIGAGVGLVLAVTKNKNLITYSVVGAIIGITLMNLYKPKINEDGKI
jgi:hypothetical protein